MDCHAKGAVHIHRPACTHVAEPASSQQKAKNQPAASTEPRANLQPADLPEPSCNQQKAKSARSCIYIWYPPPFGANNVLELGGVWLPKTRSRFGPRFYVQLRLAGPCATRTSTLGIVLSIPRWSLRVRCGLSLHVCSLSFTNNNIRH